LKHRTRLSDSEADGAGCRHRRHHDLYAFAGGKGCREDRALSVNVLASGGAGDASKLHEVIERQGSVGVHLPTIAAFGPELTGLVDANLGNVTSQVRGERLHQVRERRELPSFNVGQLSG
jgi:hypothetical protein